MGTLRQRIRVGDALHARFRGSGGAATVDRRLEELEAEVVLLREENARLAAEQALPANPGRVVEQLRAVPTVKAARESEADDAWEQMLDARVTRQLLLGVCIELERLGVRLRQQLEAGQPEPQGHVFQLGPAGDYPPAQAGDAVLAVPLGSRPPASSSASEGV